MSPRTPSIPRLPSGLPAWFTYPHNTYLERLHNLPPGAVLHLYQTHLVEAAQRMLDENSDVHPLADEQEDSPTLGKNESEVHCLGVDAGAKSASGTKAASALRRRGAIRIPELSGPDSSVYKRKPASAAVADSADERSASGTKRAVGLRRRGAIRVPELSGPDSSVYKRKPAPSVAADGDRVATGRIGDARDGNGNVSSRTRTSSRRTGSGRRSS